MQSSPFIQSNQENHPKLSYLGLAVRVGAVSGWLVRQSTVLARRSPATKLSLSDTQSNSTHQAHQPSHYPTHHILQIYPPKLSHSTKPTEANHPKLSLSPELPPPPSPHSQTTNPKPNLPKSLLLLPTNTSSARVHPSKRSSVPPVVQSKISARTQRQ